MTLTGSQAMFLVHIASGFAPTGVPVPYDKSQEADAKALEKLGLIERHHVGTDKVGAFFTPAGALAFGSILNSVK